MNLIVFFFINKYAYAVLPYESRNVDSNVYRIVIDYMEEELSSYGSVLERNKVQEFFLKVKECESDTCLKKYSEEYDLENIVFVYLDRLGEKYLLRVKVFNSKEGKFVYNQRDVADRESDLNIIVERMAKSVYEGKSIEKVVSTETITGYEAEEEPRKRRTRRYLTARVGSIFPLTGYYDENRDVPLNLSRFILGFHYEVKKTSVSLEYAVFSRGFGFEFPVRFYTSTGDNALFYEFVPGYYFMPDIYENGYWFNDGSGRKIAGGNGPALGIGGGFILFHTYDIQFIINAKYLFILNNGPDSGVEITFGLLAGR